MMAQFAWHFGGRVFTCPGWPSVLYVGQRPMVHKDTGFPRDTDQMLQWPTATVLEVWPQYAAKVREMTPRTIRVVVGDVRRAAELFPPNEFSLSCWRSGPEHVPRGDFAMAMGALEQVTSHAVLAVCPWGTYQQAAIDENPHQEHMASLYPEDFLSLGYEVWTFGRPHEKTGEIWARKCLAPDSREAESPPGRTLKEIRLRGITAADIELLRVWRNSLRRWFLDETVIEPAAQAAWWQRYLATSPPDFMWVVDAVEQCVSGPVVVTPVGTVALLTTGLPAGTAELARVATAVTGYCRKGVATNACNQVLAIARQHQIRTLRVRVKQTEPGMVRFYERLGFAGAGQPVMTLEL